MYKYIYTLLYIYIYIYIYKYIYIYIIILHNNKSCEIIYLLIKIIINIINRLIITIDFLSMYYNRLVVLCYSCI